MTLLVHIHVYVLFKELFTGNVFVLCSHLFIKKIIMQLTCVDLNYF